MRQPDFGYIGIKARRTAGGNSSITSRHSITSLEPCLISGIRPPTELVGDVFPHAKHIRDFAPALAAR